MNILYEDNALVVLDKPAGLSSRASVTGCSLRGLGAALRGSSNAVPAARATHRWASGHFSHRGAPFGTQTSAPSSIRA